jgi:GTP-binding protein HflX
MPALTGPALVAFNKIDRLDSETLALAEQKYPEAVFISATQRLGLETLRQRLLQLIDEPVEANGLTQR